MKFKLTTCMLVVLLMGCQKSADKQNSALIESAAPPPAASPAAAGAVTSGDVSASALPVEEDFEQKAEATVTASTVNQELDKLEKEIGN